MGPADLDEGCVTNPPPLTSNHTTGFKLVPHPVPHPEPSYHRVSRAREACDEALSYIAFIEEELSYAPGTKPERRPEFWLHHLRVLTGNLLLTLEAQDACH